MGGDVKISFFYVVNYLVNQAHAQQKKLWINSSFLQLNDTFRK
jgi:hypothetical protein